MNIQKAKSLDLILENNNQSSDKILAYLQFPNKDPRCLQSDIRRSLIKSIKIPKYIILFYFTYAFFNFTIACKYLVKTPWDFIISILNILMPIFKKQKFKHTSFLSCLIAFGYIIVTLQFSLFDISVLYHSLRGQSAVKLYGAGLAIQIFQKVLTFAGALLLINLTKILQISHDCRNLIPQVLLSCVYLMGHFFIYYLDFTLYIIVINSQPKNMLIYFFVINLGKLKNAIYKKFELNNFRKNVIFDAKDFLLKITYSIFFILIHWQRINIQNILRILMVLGCCYLIDNIRHFSTLSIAGKQQQMTKIYNEAINQYLKPEQRQIQKCCRWDFNVLPYILLFIKLIHILICSNNMQNITQRVFQEGYIMLLIYCYILSPIFIKILFPVINK